MALTEAGPLLLRRPLPPLKKKSNKSKTETTKKDDKDTKCKCSTGEMKLYNSLERETTRQKTDEFDVQKAKMIEYRKRLELMFSHGKPRGGDPFPFRMPKKPLEINFNAFLEDSYEPPPPVFTLDDFLRKNANENNFDHIGPGLVENSITPWHTYNDKETVSVVLPSNCQRIFLDQNDLPEVEDRKPLRQQLIEEKAYMLEQYADKYEEQIQHAVTKRSMIWPSVVRPTYVAKDGKKFPLEDVLYENDRQEDLVESEIGEIDYPESQKTFSPQRKDTSTDPGNDPRSAIDTEFTDGELVLVNSPPLFFQGGRTARSPSPFEFADEQSVFPAELAVLECAYHGGTSLSLKAHFLDSLPDISKLHHTLTHVNLSFNDFMRMPTELFHLTQLETLKMRNNPIHEIPREIKKFKKLKNLVLSFCCISSLPPSIFKLSNLESLDLSYNRITFCPDDVNKLRQLQVLNFEGNQLQSFPRSILQMMNLRSLNVVNNLTHPLFWKSTAPPQPQQLIECCATYIAQTGQQFDLDSQDLKLNAYLKTISNCDFCGGPKFGQGIRVIKPAAELFGVKNLPILFNVCSQNCRKTLRTSTEVCLSPDFPE